MSDDREELVFFIVQTLEFFLGPGQVFGQFDQGCGLLFGSFARVLLFEKLADNLVFFRVEEGLGLLDVGGVTDEIAQYGRQRRIVENHALAAERDQVRLDLRQFGRANGDDRGSQAGFPEIVQNIPRIAGPVHFTDQANFGIGVNDLLKRFIDAVGKEQRIPIGFATE